MKAKKEEHKYVHGNTGKYRNLCKQERLRRLCRYSVSRKKTLFICCAKRMTEASAFDTARAYSDSEEKLDAAFEGMREKVFISTKTMAKDVEGFWKDLETNLSLLKTDYIDIYQFHNPSFCPKLGRWNRPV